MSLFNIAATSEDDDGEAGATERQMSSYGATTVNPKRITYVLQLAEKVGLTREQIDSMVEKKYGLPLEKLNNAQIDALINFLRRPHQA